jgi:hypothetical protein
LLIDAAMRGTTHGSGQSDAAATISRIHAHGNPHGIESFSQIRIYAERFGFAPVHGNEIGGATSAATQAGMGHVLAPGARSISLIRPVKTARRGGGFKSAAAAFRFPVRGLSFSLVLVCSARKTAASRPVPQVY